jgi:hypothetical protein
MVNAAFASHEPVGNDSGNKLSETEANSRSEIAVDIGPQD